MNKQLTSFMHFVRTHGVVGLAVGLAIGTQVGKVVESLVTNLINPLVGFVLGDTKGLEQLAFTFSAGDRSATIGWGAVVSALLTLLVVSAIIYWVVSGLKLDKADKK